MSLNQLLAILKARKAVLLSVFAGVIALAGLAVLLLPSQYTSTATVLVDVKSPDPIMGMVLPAMMTPGYMATQVDLIESDRVAIKAIRALKLNENAILVQQWQEENEGKGSLEAWIADRLAKNLKVKPARESNVMTIAYEASDPEFAAIMANTYAQSYIDVTSELRVEPAKKYNAIFDTLADQIRTRLEKAQSRLSGYQQEKGLIATDERLDIENARLADLSATLTALQAKLAETTGRERQSRRDAERTEEVLASPVVSTLKAELSRLQGKLEEHQSQMGDNHPQVIETKANIEGVRARIQQETLKVSAAVGSNNTVNESRVSEARAALEAQRTKVLQLKAQRDEASVLLRDVDNLQKAYDTLQARSTQATVESQSTQTNVTVVGQAVPSLKASSPKTFLIMGVAIFGGFVLSITTVLLMELRDRRVRTTDDVLNDLQLPLVGVLLKAPDEPSSLLGSRIQPWLARRAPTRSLSLS